MDKANEMLEKLLEEHPRELIMGALEEMHNMSVEELEALGKLSQLIDKYEDETTNQ